MIYIPSELYFTNFKKKSVGIFTYCSFYDFIKLKRVSKDLKQEINIAIGSGILEFYYYILMKKYFIIR